MAQAGDPWSLAPGLLFYSLAVFSFSRNVPAAAPSKPLSPRVEAFLFSLILVLAFALRFFRIDSLPSGLHPDQGLTGFCALRILHEGWRPFAEIFDFAVPEPLLFYQVAGWFGLAGSSFLKFHLLFIFLSLAAFPFVYWTCRQWAGQRTALFALFILAVMRWNWIEARNGYPSTQVPFYLFGALAFWLYWRKSGKKWAFYLSALFVGTGFYTYQAFKIVPLLMLIFALDEYFHQRKKSPKPFIQYFLIVLVLIAPLLMIMAQRGQIGHRESELFIGSKVVKEGSLKPLWDVWTGTALMFNRAGDPNPRHNIPGHRMLDDVTGVLFVLGAALLWRRRKEPGAFYPLVGFGVMSLTGLLSTDPAHSNRLVSLTPFVAFFAGSALVAFEATVKTAFKGVQKLPLLLVLAVLTGMTLQNSRTYFIEQAKNEYCWRSFDPAATEIGKTIERFWKDRFVYSYYFLIDPSYFQNLTVRFLAYDAKKKSLPFSLNGAVFNKFPAGEPLLFFLGEGKSGQIDFLNTLFPYSQDEKEVDRDGDKLKSPSGHIFLYGRYVQEERVAAFHGWDRGLKGNYINSNDWAARPLMTLRDPVLNFTSKHDFPFMSPPPFRIRWTGTLEVPSDGVYQFQCLTTDRVRFWLDGNGVMLENMIRLKAGMHPLKLEFEKDSGDTMALTLIWKKPGEEKWEVVPATAFGKIR